MILVFNSGSTSLKFGLFRSADLSSVAHGEIDWADGNRSAARLTLAPAQAAAQESTVSVENDIAAARCALKALENVCTEPATAVGHRVVHGGSEFQQTTLINDSVRAGIRSLNRLAPLHNPPALSTIEAMLELLPGVPQVAVFDTSFYRELPEAARLHSVPYEWHEQFGIWRFGFHGLSHEYCAARAAEMLGRPLAELRIVSCHLGGGCSATAIHGDRAVASTMGFSPLEGLVMGTRSGSVDPGLLLHLQRECGMSSADLDLTLNRHSGLLGISGLSPDYAALERAAEEGHERAGLAITLFNDRLRSAIASLASTMNGADAILFTDRIGERSPAMRRELCAKLGFMGVVLDDGLNSTAMPDADVGAANSAVRVLVIHTREELMVARETRRVLMNSGI